jgi:hypothetical protein
MKKLFITLGSIQIFIALGAIPAGFGYLSDTSGQGMGTTVELLKNSPLTSFLIPGLFLLIVHGLGNVIGAILSFRKIPLAGYWGLILGLVLCLWIIIQVYWISLSSFMQPLFLLIGIAEALFGYLIIKREMSKWGNVLKT